MNARTQMFFFSSQPGKIIVDAAGNQNYMTWIPAYNVEDKTANAGTGLHPAFIRSGVSLKGFWAGMYQASNLGGKAVSQPGKDPWASINFDTANAACNAMGAGWHIMTNAEWAAIALWCWANGTMPTGNNNYGRETSDHSQVGIRVDGLAPGAAGTARTFTGSGPIQWRHDLTPAGLADMNGNVWAMVGAGYRLVDGEIQVIADNDAAVTGADLSATSALWQAIDGSGALVAPGTAGTLKFNASNADGSGVAILDNVVVNQSDGTTSTYNTFESTAVDGINVLAAPDRLKQLGIFPADAGLGGDGMWMRNLGERFPIRGGVWYNGGTAGVFAVDLLNPRTGAGAGLGFRPAFIEP